MLLVTMLSAHAILWAHACCDNPFARSCRSAASGLVTMDAASGTLVAFAQPRTVPRMMAQVPKKGANLILSSAR
jgi:hypothetical protein